MSRGLSPTRHVVWDWNGTLLDDLPIVVKAVNAAIHQFGELPITPDDYRDHYTRPVRHFYEALMGRAIDDEEWLRLDTGFHESYFRLAATVDLVADARPALDLVDAAGWTQSLLSMSPQNWLLGVVDRLGLTHRFTRIDGLSGPGGGLKADYLAAHLQRLGLDGAQVVVIGDTPDDVAAGRHAGARQVLYHGGSHHLDRLHAEDVPVAESLVEAARLAVSPP
ncbi:MAG TPA: HAD family hydrolase [Acidimicrobiia bacterium]